MKLFPTSVLPICEPATKTTVSTALEGDSFQIATFGSFSDSGFTFNFDSAALDPGLTWDTSQFANTGTIAVIPEPSHALLMLVGLAGAACRRRRCA
jgi:hypothetical protein